MHVSIYLLFQNNYSYILTITNSVILALKLIIFTTQSYEKCVATNVIMSIVSKIDLFMLMDHKKLAIELKIDIHNLINFKKKKVSKIVSKKNQFDRLKLK